MLTIHPGNASCWVLLSAVWLAFGTGCDRPPPPRVPPPGSSGSGSVQTEEQPGAAQEQGAPQPGAEDDRAGPPAADGQRLTFQQALDAARSRYPDAPAIEVEVEQEQGRELLEVELLVEGEIREVYMDPTTGEIVREAVEELSAEEEATLPVLERKLREGEVTLASAIELATAKYDAERIREIELEIHGEEELVLEVEVAEDDGMVEWVLDPVSGEVQGREGEDHAIEPAP